ncbi:MAG: hypothetical protein NUV84_03250, partial [Candidatus Uhrbacteria bacterium]|nr:hypothetical protein [Candidatus Uhrbacteria bacterium]
FAEWYQTKDDVTAGDVVALTQETFTYSATQSDPFTGEILDETVTKILPVLKRAIASDGKTIFGVVSTSPIQVIGSDVKRQGSHPMPIALSGRVPLRVSSENGSIELGDYLTASSTSGVAMKASPGSQVVAVALGELSDSEGIVQVFIKNFWWEGVQSSDLQSGVSNDQLGFWEVDTLRVNSSAVFNGQVTVKGPLVVGNNSAGRARILAGDTRVNVMFDQPYPFEPIVTATLRTLTSFVGVWAVQEERTQGFVIMLEGPLGNDVEFNWSALAVDGGEVTISDGSVIDIGISIQEVPQTVSFEVPVIEEELSPEVFVEEVLVQPPVEAIPSIPIVEEVQEPPPEPVVE